METIWNWFAKRPKLGFILLAGLTLFILWPSGADKKRDSQLAYEKKRQEQKRVSDSLKNIDLTAKWGPNYKARMDSVAKVVSFVLDSRKYGKKATGIKKKHPEWSWEECDKISRGRIWIGMSVEMLYCEMGRPDRINPSNYGDGNRYQLVWDDKNPGMFYTDDSQIIQSWN